MNWIEIKCPKLMHHFMENSTYSIHAMANTGHGVVFNAISINTNWILKGGEVRPNPVT